MRDARLVYVITAAANKQLQTNAVGVTQTEVCTEWKLGDKGYCVCNASHYPPKHLLEAIVRYFTPPKPVRSKKDADN